MAKRRVFILPLLCLCTVSAFSLSSGGSGKNAMTPDFSISAGGRIFYNGMFDIWEYSYSYTGHVDPYLGIAALFDTSFHDNNGFGIGGFFDATYAEISMDLIFGSFKPNSRKYTGDFELKSTQFGFTILGKFPFVVGRSVTFFPLAGIDYQVFLSGEAEGQNIKRDDMGNYQDIYDAFSLVVGAGLDFNLIGKLYLRGEVLCNFRMEGDSDKELKRLAKESDMNFSLFTFGPRVSIGIGYRF